MTTQIGYKIYRKISQITNCQLDRLLNYRIEKQNFYLKKGYKLNLKEPKSFCVKVIWKKVYDRNPLLPLTADKYLVRCYIEDVLGKVKSDNIIVP